MLNLARQHDDVGVYRPRNPQQSGYFCRVQDHFEQLEMLWQDRHASRYGFWRPYVTDVIYRYLECGEWLCSQVLKSVPHRQWVFSLPKRLRIDIYVRPQAAGQTEPVRLEGVEPIFKAINAFR